MKTTMVITTYNSEEYIGDLLDSITRQNSDIHVVFADDGSTDETVVLLNYFKMKYKNVTILDLEHKERGNARKVGIECAFEIGNPYLMIIDADMYLSDNLIKECVLKLETNRKIGGLILKEIPFSEHDNLMTKIKVFERTILNNSSEIPDYNSIEAARFWSLEAYKVSGGINPYQIAFEETQPTIRYIEGGGLILKHMGGGIYHNEKKVTLINIIQKKKYQFKMMNRTLNTEKKGFFKALQRWYFFRPVMYKKENLKMYFKHPFLVFGMIIMYIILTVIGCTEILKSCISTKIYHKELE